MCVRRRRSSRTRIIYSVVEHFFFFGDLFIIRLDDHTPVDASKLKASGVCHPLRINVATLYLQQRISRTLTRKPRILRLPQNHPSA